MTTMTLTLNGKLINATQCIAANGNIEGAVRCTARHTVQGAGLYGEELTPVPKGLQALGPTRMGVKTVGNKYTEMHANDWYLVYPGEDQGIVLTNEAFCFIFASELGK